MLVAIGAAASLGTASSTDDNVASAKRAAISFVAIVQNGDVTALPQAFATTASADAKAWATGACEMARSQQLLVDAAGRKFGAGSLPTLKILFDPNDLHSIKAAVCSVRGGVADLHFGVDGGGHLMLESTREGWKVTQFWGTYADPKTVLDIWSTWKTRMDIVRVRIEAGTYSTIDEAEKDLCRAIPSATQPAVRPIPESR